jgi:glucosamine--fructose-6-phosphate aminotransferase (isomerizing)
MCGIVGAVARATSFPSSCRACSGWNTAAMTPAVWPCTPPAWHPAAAGGPAARPQHARVAELLEQVQAEHLSGGTGIAHTRWATHGAPAVHNAHPHFSHGTGRRQRSPAAWRWCTTASSKTTKSCAPALQARGYVFASQTDTEVIAHLVDSHYSGDLFDAVQASIGRAARRLRHRRDAQGRTPPRGGRRAGSPLVLGVGKAGGEAHFWPATPWRWRA